MELLIASIAALLLGPVILRLAGRRGGLLSVIDGFVVAALLGLIGVQVLPQSLAVGGGWAALAAAIGFAIPPLLERRWEKLDDAMHGAMLWTGMIGLAVHAMLDGAALVPETRHGHPPYLALGVVLHRVPLGMVIWWTSRRARGTTTAFAVVALLSAATTIGYFGADSLLASLPMRGLAAFQALVAGSLLHLVIGHVHRGPAEPPLDHRWAALGALMAVAAMLDMSEPGHELHHHAASSSGEVFYTLALESAPALLLAFAGAGLMRGFIGAGSLRWLGKGGHLAQSTKGMLFGLPLPICSCGILPVYRSLVLQGAPASAAIAFLIATPEIGLDAILITVPLLGADLAIARLVAAAVVALGVATLLGRRIKTRDAPVEAQSDTGPKVALGTKIADGLRFGFGELFDHIGPWVVIGLAVAALSEPLFEGDWLRSIPPGLEVPMMALVGLPGYVCASGATPLVAVLMHKGMSAGAGIAFLLTGPATNVTTFAVLSSLHGKRIAIGFALAVAAAATAAGLLVNILFPGPIEIPFATAQHEEPALLNMVALGVLGFLCLSSLYRQGPRGVVAQVFKPYDQDTKAHGHEHDHAGHDHEGHKNESPDGPDDGPCVC